MLIDYGVAARIEAIAVGQPGQRTFYLQLLGDGNRSAVLKLEKQHMAGLLTAIRGFLDESRLRGSAQAAGPSYFPNTPDYELTIGELGIAFLPEEGKIALEARELQAGDDRDVTSIRVRLAPDQSETLIAQLDEIVRAGRPACALCGGPIDPDGHTCPRSNGHSRQEIPEGGEQDREGLP